MGFKQKLKEIWNNVFECFKRSFSGAIMYFLAGLFLLWLTVDADKVGMTDKRWAWTVVCILCAGAYNFFVSYVNGGNQYEMLVSGNMKRISAMNAGGEYKISAHKLAKEYRVWKGFVIGLFMSFFCIVTAIVFGINQEKIVQALTMKDKPLPTALGVVVMIMMFLAGWSILPFYHLNAGGTYVNFYLSLLMALIPVIVTGVAYIAGAYGRRRKSLRAQELADREMAAKEAKPKKINYGGLPGTKPRKRK